MLSIVAGASGRAGRTAIPIASNTELESVEAKRRSNVTKELAWKTKTAPEAFVKVRDTFCFRSTILLSYINKRLIPPWRHDQDYESKLTPLFPHLLLLLLLLSLSSMDLQGSIWRLVAESAKDWLKPGPDGKCPGLRMCVTRRFGDSFGKATNFVMQMEEKHENLPKKVGMTRPAFSPLYFDPSPFFSCKCHRQSKTKVCVCEWAAVFNDLLLLLFFCRDSQSLYVRPTGLVDHRHLVQLFHHPVQPGLVHHLCHRPHRLRGRHLNHRQAPPTQDHQPQWLHSDLDRWVA